MNSLIHALEAAYADAWREIMAGAIAFDLLYFAVGAAFYFFLYERRGRFSLLQLPRYIIDPRLAYPAAPLEHARQSSKVDRQSWVLRFLWAPPLAAIMTSLALVVGVYLQGRFNAWFGARMPVDWPEWAIMICQVSVIFLIGDFGNYWNHRWMHRFPLYWSFHRVHHSAETLNYFTGHREHPLEVFPSMIIQGLCNGFGAGLILWATGTPLVSGTLPALVALGVFWNIRTILYHSHIPLSFGKLDYLIGGPIIHQLHHSAEARHFSRNFGVQLFCWDWLFGTLYVPAKGEAFRLGLSEDELGARNPHNTLKGLYWEPMVHAWRTIFRQQTAAREDQIAPRPQP
jgi:sterol desaturase/sphingolipid hydroxylase (fatty acid hydroxylase superfamily)